ncbi:esterase [Pseudomonas syringae pv. actinidiae ICMP 18886]|nr:esterase [Pseudomonas syringae pv. actinidiae ICMP 18886]EPN67525.1 esterase [Pseudomonas syringae pv. actinidiae ICMP 19101]
MSAISLVAMTNTATTGAWGELAESMVDAIYIRSGRTAYGNCSG